MKDELNEGAAADLIVSETTPEPEVNSLGPIFIVDDDPLIADCIRIATEQGVKNLFGKNSALGASHEDPVLNYRRQPTLPSIKVFPDAVAAITATTSQVPALIFLDVLLTGPNGFTMLNELASYPETTNIPIVLVSSLNLSSFPLSHYNVVKTLTKETMTPTEIASLVEEYYGQ